MSTNTIQCSFLELTIHISGFSKFSFLCVAILCFKEFWVRCIPGKRWEFCFSFHRTKPFGDTALKIYTSPFSEVGEHTATLKCALKIVSGSFMMFLDKIWSLRPVPECINSNSFVKMDKVELWELETKWTKTKLRWSQKGSMLQHFKRCRTQICSFDVSLFNHRASMHF